VIFKIENIVIKLVSIFKFLAKKMVNLVDWVLFIIVMTIIAIVSVKIGIKSFPCDKRIR